MYNYYMKLNRKEKNFMLSSLLSLLPVLIGTIHFFSIPVSYPMNSSIYMDFFGLPILLYIADFGIKLYMVCEIKKSDYTKEMALNSTYLIPAFSVTLACLQVFAFYMSVKTGFIKLIVFIIFAVLMSTRYKHTKQSTKL